YTRRLLQVASYRGCRVKVLKRYFTPNKKGQLKCSEAAMAMFKDPQGEKLRDLLKQHGDFRAVEVEVQKLSIQTSKNGVEGGAMIANARRWALAKGLVRTNDVHGLEEYKIPTFEGFSFSNEASQQSKVKGTFEAE
ncbi:unnamed protein product, partial [Symbiodinium microadriaticum]